MEGSGFLGFQSCFEVGNCFDFMMCDVCMFFLHYDNCMDMIVVMVITFFITEIMNNIAMKS